MKTLRIQSIGSLWLTVHAFSGQSRRAACCERASLLAWLQAYIVSYKRNLRHNHACGSIFRQCPQCTEQTRTHSQSCKPIARYAFGWDRAGWIPPCVCRCGVLFRRKPASLSQLIVLFALELRAFEPKRSSWAVTGSRLGEGPGLRGRRLVIARTVRAAPALCTRATPSEHQARKLAL